MQNTLIKQSISNRLDKHFLACAAAAGAAAISAQRADATIRYSGLLNLNVDPATPAGIYIRVSTLTVNTSGAADPLWNLNLFNITYSGGYTGVAFYPRTVNDKFVGTADGIVSKLAANTLIGPASTLGNVNANAIAALTVLGPGGTDLGLPWVPGDPEGYMGFRVAIGANLVYGWARLQLNEFDPTIGASGAVPFTLRDFAYQDTPNTAIAAGAVPEPASAAALGLLALGALGVRHNRRSK